jgi:isocitrate dehydrogenase kinase/phosphatase
MTAVSPVDAPHSQANLALAIAESILQGFNRHFTKFQEITAGARQRFESADWKGTREASRQRILVYDEMVDANIDELKKKFQLQPLEETLWKKVKSRYILLLQEHQQPELAETFYTSVFCRLFHRQYYTNEFIFVRSATSTDYIEAKRPAYHVLYPAKLGLRNTIEHILRQHDITLPYENLKRDVRYITKALCQRLESDLRHTQLNFQFQVINALFYRNKAAYIVGRIVNGQHSIPFALPILNNERGSIYVDALLLGERALSKVFEFSYVYFMVDYPVPSAIVNFLQELMPSRRKEGLYSAIGFHKHGKTDFYRDFLHHLKYSDDELIIAPGIKGMVMMVFTLPSYPYVFKVIRDRFAPPKDIDRKTVEAKYQLVKQHDRVGRMADMLEYSDVSLPRRRFSQALLDELLESCAESIEFDGEHIVIKHVYIEDRMVPLNIDMDSADETRMSNLMRGYGEAIKELAAANIFPGDLLFKNFGVTPLGRVVFYDYDEVSYLTECNFRKIPPPRSPEDELAAEPWYNVAPNDIFPEEFATFLFSNARVRNIFLQQHGDLLKAEFWWQKQKNIRAEIYEDIFPYSHDLRFSHHAAQKPAH